MYGNNMTRFVYHFFPQMSHQSVLIQETYKAVLYSTQLETNLRHVQTNEEVLSGVANSVLQRNKKESIELSLTRITQFCNTIIRTYIKYLISTFPNSETLCKMSAWCTHDLLFIITIILDKSQFLYHSKLIALHFKDFCVMCSYKCLLFIVTAMRKK